jgi:PAS domain S-box-containing protein
MERDPGRPSGRSAALRDLLWILLAVLVSVVLGSTTHEFDRLYMWVDDRFEEQVGDALAALLLLSTGLAIFALVQGRFIRRELVVRRHVETRFRQFVEKMPAVIYTWDPRLPAGTAATPYVSPQVEQILGFTAEEWTADPELWIRRIHPDDRDRVLAASERADRTGDSLAVEYRHLRKDGSVIWVRDEAVVIEHDASGKPSLVQGVMYDVTERKRAERDLAEAEERYRTLVEQLPVVVYQDAIDDVSTALYISPQYEVLFGFPPEARLHDPEFWLKHVHPDDRDRVLELSRWTNETGEPFSTEYRFIASDGRVVWVRDEAAVLRDDAGAPMCWQGVLLDITARKHAEEALSHRDAVLQAIGFAAERFLKSHDLESALPEVLERLGTSSGAGRVYVFENLTLEDERLAMRLRRQWFAPGVETIADAQDRTYPYNEGFVRWRAVLSAGNELHGLTRDLPEAERKHLEGEGVQSQIVVPIFVGEQWWGFLGFDDYDTARVWPLAEVEALKTAADILGAAIGRTNVERQRAEALAARQELEARTSAVLASALEAIVTMDIDGRIVDFNAAAEKLFGYRLEDVAGRPLADVLIPPELRERHRSSLEHYLSTGEPTILGKHLEVEATRADGRRIPIELTVTEVQMPNTKLFTGFVRDLTERRRAEQQLREAEQRYRTLVENLPAATYVDDVDEVCTTLYVSPQIEVFWGYTPQEWISNPDVWIDALHPDDRERILSAAARHNELGEPFEVEYRFRAKDGRWTWVSDHATAVRDDQGRLAFSQGVMFDVTERRQAEEQLRDAEERYRAIVEHVPAAIYVDVPDGSMQSLYVSPQIEQIMGCTPEEFIARPDVWLDLMVDEQHREEMRETYLQAIGERRSWNAEYLIRRPDGREVWVHDETTFVTDDDGKPLFLQGVMYDVTDRKLAERALQESERGEREAAERLRSLDEMKNTFLAAVSHELRSPLTSILGLSLTLEQQQLPEPERNELLGRLAMNARKLDDLLKDLLDIDRLSRGIVTPKVRPTDVAEIVERVIANMDLPGERSVSVESRSVVVPVDPPKIERIVENLVMNAARHTGPAVGIWVRVWEQDGGAVIAVEDEGPGIPVGLRRDIFEPFRQGPMSSSHAPGTGIGLSLVAMFSDLHGGRAWVEDREGGGASFRVFLPGEPPDPGGNSRAALGAPATVARDAAS